MWRCSTLRTSQPNLPSRPLERLRSRRRRLPESLPFLAVLRNTVDENERMSQQLLQRYRTLAEQEYRGDYTCNSDHLKWSDWVACLHARVGVPRWLTAATISLGIVFSVWLCLVIPSAAPKQRIRALVIKTEKPSAALAKAKEAEAASKACEAAGVDTKTVVSVVRRLRRKWFWSRCTERRRRRRKVLLRHWQALSLFCPLFNARSVPP